MGKVHKIDEADNPTSPSFFINTTPLYITLNFF